MITMLFNLVLSLLWLGLNVLAMLALATCRLMAWMVISIVRVIARNICRAPAKDHVFRGEGNDRFS
ncbi:hypothetical protein ELG79_36505 [Rhizobium leguminosarum]|uniref:hypothetical protein n=1 Tax=Rhizobium leguminosarum TaxID=384 RepID=UPI00102F79F8|nr:hypothetical protein [Rhizobium leguminosarum]TBG08425.1 hypothetical protein ELG79_36505 [Rhizobium leguminosarum]